MYSVLLAFSYSFILESFYDGWVFLPETCYRFIVPKLSVLHSGVVCGTRANRAMKSVRGGRGAAGILLTVWGPWWRWSVWSMRSSPKIPWYSGSYQEPFLTKYPRILKKVHRVDGKYSWASDRLDRFCLGFKLYHFSIWKVISKSFAQISYVQVMIPFVQRVSDWVVRQKKTVVVLWVIYDTGAYILRFCFFSWFWNRPLWKFPPSTLEGYLEPLCFCWRLEIQYQIRDPQQSFHWVFQEVFL